MDLTNLLNTRLTTRSFSKALTIALAAGLLGVGCDGEVEELREQEAKRKELRQLHYKNNLQEQVIGQVQTITYKERKLKELADARSELSESYLIYQDTISAAEQAIDLRTQNYLLNKILKQPLAAKQITTKTSIEFRTKAIDLVRLYQEFLQLLSKLGIENPSIKMVKDFSGADGQENLKKLTATK